MLTYIFTFLINSGVFQNETIYYILFALWIILFRNIFRTQKITLVIIKNKEMVLFIIASLIMVIFYTNRDVSLVESALFYFIAPALMLYAGYYLTTIPVENGDSRAMNCIIALILGCCLHALLNMTINFGVSRYAMTDFFSGEYESETNQACINTVIFSIFPLLILCKNKKHIKIIGWLVFFISLAFGFELGTRSTFIILAIDTLAVGIAFFIHTDKETSNTRVAKILIVVPALLIFIYIAYEMNAFNIKSAVENSNLILRMSDSLTGKSDSFRGLLLAKGLQNFLSVGLGPQQTYVEHYHNAWLDIARVCGFIPALLMLAFHLIILFRSYALLKKTSIDENLKYFIFSSILAMLINYSVEPIFDGYFTFNYRFCFISGICLALTNKSSYSENLLEISDSL